MPSPARGRTRAYLALLSSRVARLVRPASTAPRVPRALLFSPALSASFSSPSTPLPLPLSSPLAQSFHPAEGPPRVARHDDWIETDSSEPGVESGQPLQIILYHQIL